MRAIEEIKRDMNLAEGCMHNRHSCDNDCINCIYLNYNKNINRLREENYQFYNSEERKEKAVKDISADRLEEICNAERDGRCVVLPYKVGDIVYGICTIKKRAIRYMVTATTIYQEYGRTLKTQVSLAETEMNTNKAAFNGRRLNDTDFEKLLGAKYFFSKEAAEQALKGLNIE